MTERERFITGFLGRCAQEGLTEAETALRIEKLESAVKQAASKQAADESPLPSIGGLLRGGLLLSTLAATGLGGTAGYLAANASTPQLEPEELKQQELLAAYRHYTNLMRRAARQRQTLAPRAPRLHHA